MTAISDPEVRINTEMDIESMDLDLAPGRPVGKVSLENVVHCLCDIYNERYEDVMEVKERSRKREYVLVRQIASFYWKRRNGSAVSLKKIGEFFSKDHSTIIHYIQAMQDLLDADRKFNRRYYEQILPALNIL